MDTMALKRININKVRLALRQERLGNKLSLSRITNLSVATCGNILSELLETGEALEIEHAPSTGGRRSRQFKYNEFFAYTLLIYARQESTVNHLYYQVSNLSGKSVKNENLQRSVINVESIDTIIADTLKVYPNIMAISIGVPGVVIDGHIDICDFQTLSQTNLKAHITEKFGIATIIENDVNATAFGYVQKKDYDDQTFAYLYYPLDQHPGSGLIIDRKIIHGATNFAGEIAYLSKGSKEHPTKNKEDFINQVTNAIRSIICIINPRHMAISGIAFTAKDIEKIESQLLQSLPEKYIPEIFLETDIHHSYIDGLCEMAFSQYSEAIF